MKSSLGQTAFVDGSVFYYDYGNYQSQTFTSVGAVSLIKLSNIKKATVYGLDLGMTWMPLDGFSLRGGLGLLHSRLGSFVNTAGSPPVLSTIPAGNKMPDAPETTFNATARYEHNLFSGYMGAIQFAGVYEADHFFEALNTPYLSAPSSWVFNGRASIAPDEKNWELAFWINNIFNEKHTIQAVDDGQPIGAGYRMFNNPRTFGVTLSHHFD